MKKFLFIIILSLLITANANAESFSNALSKAFKNNSELNAERENLNISEQELKISQGNYLPTVTLSGSKSQEDTNKLTNQSGGDASINDVDPVTKSISISQTLIDFGRGAELSKSKMLIDETPSISIIEMRAKARRMKQRDDIQLLVVDYLQLMQSTTKRAKDNRQIEISEISSGLKALAKELHIPVIVLAQVNRNPEERKGGRPRISDLRESGSIEQDADVVGLLMRPERYADDDDKPSE